MSYFKDVQSREPMELIAGARTRTFWGEQVLLSLVEIDINSECLVTLTPTSKQGW